MCRRRGGQVRLARCRECPPVARQEGGEAHMSGQEVHSLALELEWEEGTALVGGPCPLELEEERDADGWVSHSNVHVLLR